MSNNTLHLDIVCELTERLYREVELPAEIVAPLPQSVKENGVTTTEFVRIMIKHLAKDRVSSTTSEVSSV